LSRICELANHEVLSVANYHPDGFKTEFV